MTERARTNGNSREKHEANLKFEEIVLAIIDAQREAPTVETIMKIVFKNMDSLVPAHAQKHEVQRIIRRLVARGVIERAVGYPGHWAHYERIVQPGAWAQASRGRGDV